jgi:uncharacterized membrane protein
VCGRVPERVLDNLLGNVVCVVGVQSGTAQAEVVAARKETARDTVH